MRISYYDNDPIVYYVYTWLQVCYTPKSLPMISEFDIHNHDSYFISTGNQFYSYVTHKIPHQRYTEPTHNESSGATY